MHRQRCMSNSDIENVVDFWRSSQGHWFSKSPRFDRHFRDVFLPLHDAVAARRHGGTTTGSKCRLARWRC